MLNRLYSYFFNKANVLRSEISKKEGESPWRVKTLAALYLFIIEMAEDFFKLLILLFKNPYDSFQLFTKQETLPICEYSYTDHRRFQKKVRLFSLAGLSSIISATIIINLILSLVLPGQLPSYAKTVNGGWDDWSLTTLAGDPPTGSAGTLSISPANTSEITGTGTASTLALKQNSYTATDDGTFSTTGNATVSLDGGTGADGVLDLSSGCSGTGMTWSSPTCTINTNTKSVFNFTTINIPSGTTLTATGSTFLTLKATGSVTIGGIISLNGGNGAGGLAGTSGPGGYAGGFNATIGGGPGGGGISNYGGGGGGHGGSGGGGHEGSGAGGLAYNQENIGGSGGGSSGGAALGSGGGGGGGSLKIVSLSQINISGGTVSVNGGNGAGSGWGGSGGGSGGRFSFIGKEIINNGAIQSNGGIGGADPYGFSGGGGGGGRIILQDDDGVISGSGSVTVNGGGVGSGGTSGNPSGVGGISYISNGFLSGTLTSTTVSGSGAGASVGLGTLPFVDSETTPKTVTAYGNAQKDVTQRKFGGASALFDGSGDYLSIPDSADWAFGAEDFTLETQVRFNTAGGDQVFFSQGESGNSNRFYWGLFGGISYFDVFINGSLDIRITNNWSPSANTWYHVALVRNGNDFKMFVDGVQVGTTQTSAVSIPDFTGNMFIGSASGPSTYMNGWMDEVRISKGIARWTSNFTPPTSAYSADPNTKLLLHSDDIYFSSGTFESATIDLGGKANLSTASWTSTIPSQSEGIPLSESGLVSYWKMDNSWNDSKGTNNGTSSGPTFSASSKYGSHAGSFNGTGLVTIPDSSTLSLDNMTIEAWVKPSSVSGSGSTIVSSYTSGSLYRATILSSGYVSFQVRNVSGSAPFVNSTVSVTDGNWHHVVAVRDVPADLLRIYIDGIARGTASDISTVGTIDPPVNLGIGDDVNNNAGPFYGLMDGVAVYNTALSASTISSHYNDVNTALKFQLATSDSSSGPWTYYGPDGTAGTYFTSSGIAIPSALSGKQYVRYKAYLSTADTAYTPTLDSLTLNYTQYPTTSTVTNLIFNTTQSGNPVWGSVSWVRSDANTASSTIKVKAQARVAGNSTNLSSATFAGYDNTNTNSSTYFDKSNINCTESDGKYGDTTGDNASKKTITCSIDPNDTTYFNPTVSGNQWLELKLILEGDGYQTPTIDAARATYSINGQPEACEVYNTETSTCTTQASASQSTSSSNYGYITFNSGIKDLDTNTGTTSPGKVLVALEYTSGSFNQATPPGFLDAYYAAANRFAANYTLSGTGLSCVVTDPLAPGYVASSVIPYISPSTNTTTWKYLCDLNTTDPVPFIPLIASWNAKQDINNTYSTAFKMRLLVSDQEGANSVGSGETAAFTVDTTSPTGSIIIDATDKASTNNSNITISCSDDTTLFAGQYALSDDGATWDAWNNLVCNNESTAIRRTLTENATTRTTTVHYKFRDTYGNESASQSKTTGQRPHNLILQDVSNVRATPPSYKSFLSWEVVSAPANGFNSYLVYRCAPTEADPTCANNTNYALVTTNTSISNNSYLDSDVTADGTYYYHIATKDNGNHLSKWSNPDTGAANPIYGKANGTQDLGEGGGGSDTSAPVISSVNIPADQITQNSAVINFTTSETANGGAFYGVTTYGSEKSSLTYSTDHSLTLTGLSTNTAYKVQLKSSDASGNLTTCDETNLNSASCSIANASQLTFTTTSVDTTAPSISGVAVSNLSSSGATVTFTTNESSDTCIAYRQGSETTYASEQCNSTLTTNHLLTLGSLSSNTTYYLKIKSRDSNSNLAQNCYVNNDNASLTNTDCSAMADAATLTFTTTSPTAAGGGGGGGGGSGKTDFDAPKISDVKAENITHDSATITWLTNENSSSLVQYGTNANSLRDTAGQVDAEISHKVILRNLKPETKYFFSPTSIDSAGNIGSPSAQSFTTLKAPSIEEEISKLSTPEAQEKTKEVLKSLEEQIRSQKENIVDPLQILLDALSPLVPEPIIIGESPEIEVASTTALVKWRTDKKSTSFVALSREDQYDAKSPEPYKQTVGNPEDSVKEHTVEVSSLLPGTKYHYQVRSKALLGDTSESRDFTFTTKSELPQITKYLQKKTDDDKTATVYWETSIPTDSVVKYTPYIKGKLDPKQSKIQGKPDLVSDHEITVSTLDPGTVYQIEVSGRDPFGNIVSKILPDFTTAIDKDAPVIAQVRIESAMISGKTPKIQTIVSYRTDEPATAQVFYAEGGSDKFKQLPEDLSFTTIHTAVITEFKPAFIYRIRVMSKDQSGNEATSRDYTILTPAQSESIIDIIIKTFENTFGWVKNIRF